MAKVVKRGKAETIKVAPVAPPPALAPAARAPQTPAQAGSIDLATVRGLAEIVSANGLS
jgi:hypothetical protein